MENIQIEVYSYADPTVKLDVLNERVAPSFLEELAGNGGGDLTLSLTDPKVLADPSLVAYRNVLKFKIGSTVVGAMIIGKKNTQLISEQEAAGETYSISGEGLRTWFNDAAVYPVGGLKRNSFDERAFNFASETGTWYNPAQWVTPTVVASWGDVIGSPWRYAPKEWPDAPTAKWIWSMNSISSAPVGDNYFRYEFTAPTGQTKYSFFAAADNNYAIYIDGQLDTVSDPESVSWSETARIDFTLDAGPHVIAVRVNNSGGPAAFIGALFKFGSPTVPTPAVMVSVTGTTGWKVAGYPSPVPGWTPGEIVMTLLEEAETRGVLFPTWLTPTFTASLDSYGNAWPRDLDWSFGIGDSLGDVIEKLEELACDVWIDPDTFELNMAIERGVDRSVYQYDVDGITPLEGPLVFVKGHNLANASIDGVAEVKNSLIMQTTDGWINVNETVTSIPAYGVLESKLETGASEAVSRAVAEVVFDQKSLPEEGASYEIIPVEGYVPWVDFNVGDWVLAPDARGLSVRRRIMSISVEEDKAGNPHYSVEFDTIFKDNESRLSKWLQKAAGGSLGGQFSNAGAISSFPIGSPILQPAGNPIIQLPVAPTNLAATSIGAWSASGVDAFSEITLTWDPVTANTDGTATIPVAYEVWGHLTSATDDTFQMFATVTDNVSIIRPFITGTQWTFKVRALNSAAAVGAFSDEYDHTMVAPTTPMDAPNAPTLSSNKGVLIVTWNGQLNSLTPPPQFRYVYATVATSSGGTYTPKGTTLSRDGRNIYISGLTVGTTYWVKLVAVDGLNISSAASTAASITLSGIDLGDLDSSIGTAIDAAKAAGEAAMIEGNLLGLDPSFEVLNDDYWNRATTDVTKVSTTPRTGSRSLRIKATTADYEATRYQRAIPVNDAQTYLLGAYVRPEGAGSTVEGGIELSVAYGPDATVSAGTATVSQSTAIGADYTRFTGQWTVPVGTRYVKPRIIVRDHSNVNVYLIDDMTMFKMTANALIVDGAITASKIGANEVVAGKLAAGSVATENLQAESVTASELAADAVTANKIAAGAITADKVSAGAISTIHLSSEVGSELDISSNDSVNILVSTISTVSDDLNTTSDTLEQMGTYYKFGVSGAEISSPGSPFSVSVQNDKIEMRELGVAVSTWSAGQLLVRSFVGEEVILGNHKIEKYGTGTVVRTL